MTGARRLTARDAAALQRTIAAGGVAVFPADTVYGLACDPDDALAVTRLYELKGRPARKAAAVMFLGRERALATLGDLGPRTRAALDLLLPGPLTALVPNPRRRFPEACGPDPTTLGIRVPALDAPVAALAAVPSAVLQSSANLSGGPDARTLDAVPATIRAGADLVLDAGPRGGRPSTVVDLRVYETGGSWSVLRPGPVGADELAAALA